MIFTAEQDYMREYASKWITNNDDLIIELGCSNGNFANLLFKKGINNYLGIDILDKRVLEAKKSYPNLNFICCDILKNLYLLKKPSIFVSFQCLEHITEDLEIIKSILPGTIMIFSVPNKPYKKAHVRWFELEGWHNRFSPYVNLIEEITFQHPRKENNRAFLFKGVKK